MTPIGYGVMSVSLADIGAQLETSCPTVLIMVSMMQVNGVSKQLGIMTRNSGYQPLG